MLRSIAICAFAATAAHANPASIVPTAADSSFDNVQHSAVDVIVHVDYDYEQDGSSILRERVGPGADPNGPVPVTRDLKFKQFRHTLTPRIETGVYHDTWLYAALPIVITQQRELRLDGVPRTSSTTIADGLLPPGGFDARDPTTPPAGDLVFRGQSRHGLDQVHLGLGVAPMNQAKDDTKPTWKIGAEIRLPVGKVMKFDAVNPSSNEGVGYGLTELKLWSSFDRRLGWAEPWMEMWWQVPLSASSDSLFQNPGFGTKNTMLGQIAGVAFGMEAYAIDNEKDHNRISLDLGARLVAHFEGRDYSEMWEVFAFAGDDRTPTNPLILDKDPTTAGVQAMSYPGISNIENYLETAARVAVRAEIGEHVRFAVMGDMVWKTDHVISFADAGIDRNNNDLIEPGTNEVNPLHVPLIDLVGHRYHSENNFGVVIGVQGQVLF